MSIKYSEHNSKCCPIMFKILSGLVVLDIIFTTVTAFVYLKDYFTKVKDTYDPITKTFSIKQEFVYLYLGSSFATGLFIVYLVFIAVWFIVNFVC